MSRQWKHVYVIYRIDLFMAEDRPLSESDMSIKSVFDPDRVTEAQVVREMERLQDLNGPKGMKYFWTRAKWYDTLD